MAVSKFGFAAKAAAWDGIKRAALQVIAVETLKEFDKSFNSEGLSGQKWKEVQRRIPGTLAHRLAKGSERTAPILTGESGRLKGSNEIRSVTSRQAVIVNDTHYASVQNEGGMVGGGITGIPHTIPARPFMVQTAPITAMQLQILKTVTGKIWTVK